MANPTFTGELVGDWTASLVVTDLGSTSAPSVVQVGVFCPWVGQVELFDIEAFGVTAETSYDSITAEQYRVTSDAEVTFRAGVEIVLKDDFVVESDAEFTAIIDPSIACQWP